MSNSDIEQAILDQAEQIKLKRFNEKRIIEEKETNNIKKGWYDTIFNGLKNKMNQCDRKVENIDETVNKYKTEYIASIASERQGIEKEIQSLGDYKGQCLHLGGRKTTWITNRYDSHGYSIESCSLCGRTI